MGRTQDETSDRIAETSAGPLALLPPQNATGNYVKIVQRLPVGIELSNNDSDKVPFFVGMSVVPYVYYKERPTGPNAGAVLRPPAALRTEPTDPPTYPHRAQAASENGS
jgi:multidrug resistance efflux pump